MDGMGKRDGWVGCREGGKGMSDWGSSDGVDTEWVEGESDGERERKI